jgi:hypothetical protein
MALRRQAFARGEVRLRQPSAGSFGDRDPLPRPKPIRTRRRPPPQPAEPGGTERLRRAPTPLHSDNEIDALVTTLRDVWTRQTLRRAA